MQGALLYATELTWNGREGVEGEYQAAINCMGRATLGALHSTPLGIVAAESGLTLARAPPDHRQARFTQRLLLRPRKHGGLEGTMTHRGSAVTHRLLTATLSTQVIGWRSSSGGGPVTSTGA